MYLIAVIGRSDINLPQICQNYDQFMFDKVCYTKTIDVDVNQVIKDISKLTDFELLEITKHFEPGITYLGVFFKPLFQTYELSRQHIISKHRICSLFLTKLDGDSLEDEIITNSNTEQNKINSNLQHECDENFLENCEDDDEYVDIEVNLANLFSELKDTRIKYSERIQNFYPHTVQHHFLLPTLRQYQIDAVKWMLYRENYPDFLPNEFIPVQSIKEYVKIFDDNYISHIFFYNSRTVQVVDKNPGDIKLPSGGILADEMGLGKTVEMLSLILLNRNRKRRIEENKENCDNRVSKRERQNVFCLCNKRRREKKRKKLIKCTKCLKIQHRKCVLKYSQNEDIECGYVCPNCWKDMPLVDSSATIIVSPVAIKKQWETEIRKHISNAEFRVLIYDGVMTTGWISPADLSNYDVVLTDYNVLRSEIYFTKNTDRKGLRNEKRFLNPTSPLTRVKWWRVCLDEAQMVETTSNLCSVMVKTLPTIHRWSVTGTPVQKHIDNLQGLMFFLDCYPYTDLSAWVNLSIPYHNGNTKPLLDVLEKIMWRSCKNDVLDQINIPPQQNIVHYVTMSDLESFFYKSQHANYSFAFNEKAQKLRNDESMSNLNSHTLKLLMEPLRKIRQDCTAPSIFQRSITNSITTKKILAPNELLSHLVTNNEADCKSELRSIISCLNGLAGIFIIREEYETAAKLYKGVLHRANEQKQGNITVDTLQQIHAIYNYIKLIEANHVKAEDLPELKLKYGELEWKYINSCYTLVKNLDYLLDSTTASIIETMDKISFIDGNWWVDILYEIQGTSNESLLIEKIRMDLQESGCSPMTDEISTIRGLNYVISIWWDKLIKARDDNLNSFKSLDYFIKNIKPKNLLTTEEYNKIDFLIKQALECHLNYEKDEEEKKSGAKKRKDKKSVTCDICKTKMIMMKYECIVFNKTFREDGVDTEGSWNPPFQEWIIRGIFNFAKTRRLYEEAVKEGESFMKLMDLFKQEYKEYSKLWVEVNYTASAYDELNMCKTRFEVVEPIPEDEDDDESAKKKKPKIKSFITIHEIESTEEDLRLQLQQAETKFVQILGRLKYLKHLEQKNEPDQCPICSKKPESKYAILQCGHIICLTCLIQMKKFQKHHLSCCICRNRQNHDDVFYATCKISEDISSGVSFIGEYSSKIEEIVRTILKLIQTDPDVKIIIFSQWDNILTVLSHALNENSIKYRTKSAKIHVCLEDFKNDSLKIACLLLPLQFGSKGLNLIEATHVFLVEPILNPGEELQAIGRIHRIGQTKLTFVHKFIVRNTIEETIYNTIGKDKSGKWKSKRVTIKNLQELFHLNNLEEVEGY